MTYQVFTGFAPDADPTTPGVITDIDNLVPTLKGYAGAPSGVDTGMDALAAAAITAGVMFKLDGTSRLFIGTATKLYEKSATTAWTDVSRVAAYNASNTNPWRFAQYGDTTLACNKGDVLQSIAGGADFADLTAPKASVMCIASGFVMLGNCNDGSTGIGTSYGDNLNRWWCSALYDETDWVPSVTTQCATGLLVDTPGGITGMKSLGYDVIAYKERSMYLGRYEGPPAVWDFTLIPGEVGCSCQEAIADLGSEHIFIGYDDFYRFNGSTPVAIGTPIREHFFADLDPAYKYRVRHTIDRGRSLIYWFYPRLGGSGSLDGCIVYNWKSNRWGIANRTIEAAIEIVNSGYSWDSLPMSTWDSWPNTTWDSSFFVEAARAAAYVGTDHKTYVLAGTSDTSSLTSGDYGEENRSTLLKRITLRYLDRPDSATCLNYYQDVHGDTWTEDATTTESTGRFDLLRAAPWHRAKFTFTGDVEVVGVSAEIQPAGVI